MEPQKENSGSAVITKHINNSKMPEEVTGDIIEPASIKIKKEIIDTTELNPSSTDFVNFIGNNDPINIKSEDIHAVIENINEETYQHMIGAEIMSEDELEEKTLHLKGEVIDMEIEDVKEEPAEKSSDSEDESTKITIENTDTVKVKKLFECDQCSYRTDRESRSKKHLLVHLSPSQVVMYSCESCAFQTKYEESLKCHMVVMHSTVPKKVYVCDRCPFQTTYRSAFKSHVDYKIHEIIEEKGMYKCPKCSYKTKARAKIPEHMKRHKQLEELLTYDCEVCPYKSKWRHCLRNHLKAHENKEEHVPEHACPQCGYSTNNRYSLETHVKTHRGANEKRFKCDACDYRVDKPYKLRKHMETHKDRSEREVFSCDHCSFNTIYRRTLEIHHLMKHTEK